jgi:hypothetical protein
MRTQLLVLLAIGACGVSHKQLVPGDGPSPDGTPNTTIDSAPPQFANAAAASFTFSSDVAGASFQCSVDRESEVPCDSPYTRTLDEGNHTFAVRATANGKTDQTPAEAVWMIDTRAPETSLDASPPVADNSTMVQFEFSANEQTVTFDCSLDNAAYAPCTSGDTFGPLTDGAHGFAVRATDRAGNVDASPAIYAWQIDTAMPDTQILSGPTATTSDRSASFTFDSPDAGAGASFDCALDSAGFAPCFSPHDIASVAEGDHTFHVRVHDSVGNVDPTPATRTWTVDLTAPDTMITSTPTGTVASASASIEFTSNEAAATFSCSLDGATPAACTSPFTVQMLGQGPHMFAVTASDAANNADASPATASWTVDTTMQP